MKKLTLGLSAAALALAGTVSLAIAADQPPAAPDARADRSMTRAEAQAHAEAMFARLDVNKDGKLDQADRAARDAQMFQQMDTDHNGSISQEEFAAHHQRGQHDGPQGGPPPAGEPAGPGGPGGRGHGGHDGPGDGGMMMRMADTNKDGAVSKDEFVAAALKRFDAMDTNKDGTVTAQERRAARQAMRGEMGGDRASGKHGGKHRRMGGDMPPPPPPAD